MDEGIMSWTWLACVMAKFPFYFSHLYQCLLVFRCKVHYFRITMIFICFFLIGFLEQISNPNLWWMWHSFQTSNQQIVLHQVLLQTKQNQERRPWLPFTLNSLKQHLMARTADANSADKAIQYLQPQVLHLLFRS